MTEQLKQARMPDEIYIYGTGSFDWDEVLITDEPSLTGYGFTQKYIRAIEQPPITVEELRGMKKPEWIGGFKQYHDGWNAFADAVIAKMGE